VLAQSDPEPLVRSASLNAVGTQDPEAALDLARRVRTDASAMVRRDAVLVLARRVDGPRIDALIELARDDDPDVRTEATRALGHADEPRVINVLLERLDDVEPSVQHAAREGLIRHAGGTVDFGTRRDNWEQWWK